jgi:hypothetical protein
VSEHPTADTLDEMKKAFHALFSPLEPLEQLLVLTDERTEARFCECHVHASVLVRYSTVDVPLDPEEQSEYRANREIVEDSAAFERMISDAKGKRSFSNIVTEFISEEGDDKPLKIIGGQHRWTAISQAYSSGVDVLHGIKVYFNLDTVQRLDVQLVSNTNIATSPDLFDRMQETASGPKLRKWCQEVDFLLEGKDFADKRTRENPMTVRAARAFIMSYYAGASVGVDEFATNDTAPELPTTGSVDPLWDALKNRSPVIWEDKDLKKAGVEFAKLIKAQSGAFKADSKVPPDYPEKAMNIAVLSGWAYIAGHLQKNKTRLEKHYKLPDSGKKDPLNAAALAKGRHRSDPANYRGLGYRTDPKERGRLVELFYLQAEGGGGITPKLIEEAIAKFVVKQAVLDVEKIKAKRTA